MIESYPNVWNHQKRVWDLPAIKAYHESNRYHERPINNPSVAKWYWFVLLKSNYLRIKITMKISQYAI